MDSLDPEVCYRALAARDPRFDGRFFVAVATTGIFCRPICPATTAKPANCRFFVSAAAAHAAGYRPCLRCRPESAPSSGAWLGTSNTVARGLALIESGALDRDDASVESLAERLGVGARHLRRLFDEHLGASPLAVARTRRVLFAKQLMNETSLPLSEVAIASGFRSIRRFNETFRALYDAPPSALRRSKASGSRPTDPSVTLRLRYRAPYDHDAILAFLAERAIDGVESIEGSVYRRTFGHGAAGGTVSVSHDASTSSLVVAIRGASVRAIPTVVASVRRVFDLDADVLRIGDHLARDRALASLVSRRPALRVPGAFDGFELAIRAVLGQQISVAAARKLAGRLVALAGARVASEGALTHRFPTPGELLDADLGALRMPSARRETLRAVARAALDDDTIFGEGGSLEASSAKLRAIGGIGPWTAQYIALRALRDPDAFPLRDRGIERAYARLTAASRHRVELATASEAWRPFRAYAAQHLWTDDATFEDDTGVHDAR